MDGTRDKAKASGTRLKGKLQHAAGELTNNNDLKAKGRANKAKGSGQKTKGRLKNAINALKN